jgi:hypothetical protein
MRQRLCRRLERREAWSVAAWRAPVTNGTSGGDKVRAILEAHSFPQAPRESLMETFARFLGISPHDLRQRLLERAYGR